MNNNYYDNWERLVKAVFDREKLKELALAHSRESSLSSISRLDSPIHEQILQPEGFDSPNTVNEPDWEPLLPSDYEDLISRSVNRVTYATKKDLYLSLCEFPILLDGGKMSFSLEKGTGKKCFMLAARGLSIVWGDTPEYWQWIPYPESRFPEVAELLDVCWFEIRGKINTSMLSSGTTYAAYLVFTSKSGIHGFAYQPAEATVGISGRDGAKRTVCLDPEREPRNRDQIVHRRRIFNRRLPPIYRRQGDLSSDRITDYPKVRADKWMEVELGEFFVDVEQDLDMEISLTETKGGNWKSGVIIQGIEIRPKAQ